MIGFGDFGPYKTMSGAFAVDIGGKARKGDVTAWMGVASNGCGALILVTSFLPGMGGHVQDPDWLLHRVLCLRHRNHQLRSHKAHECPRACVESAIFGVVVHVVYPISFSFTHIHRDGYFCCLFGPSVGDGRALLSTPVTLLHLSR